ncbi:MAG: collagen binding domain-containing protein [Promethearchaeota archaeon]
MSETITHPILSLEGIDEALEEKLKSFRISVSEDLLAFPEQQIVNLLSNIEGLTKDTIINSLLPQARYMRIEGLSNQIIKDLIKLNNRSYQDLVITQTDIILNEFKDSVSIETVLKWQLEAARLQNSITLHLTILDKETGEPLESAETRINNTGYSCNPVIFKTNNNGLAFFEKLMPGTYTVVISKDGYKRQVATFSRKNFSDKIKMVIRLETGESTPIVIDEFSNGAIYTVRNHEWLRSKVVQLHELPSIPPLIIHEIKDDKVRASSLWSKQIDDIIYVYVLNLPREDIPENIEIGNIVSMDKEGKWQLMEGMTFRKYRKEFLKRRSINLNKSKGG